VMKYGDKNAHISCMCIKPKYQGRGFGRLMMEYVEDVARRDKLISMSLGTEDTMKAYQLYKKYGFKTVVKHIVE
ncbi:MAG: GNAT family N-acetyltransferase, partial [Tenericutes bacterium]|nr:GNAT family N-acetyltransferase [Mycoplasmatota bacterium]